MYVTEIKMISCCEMPNRYAPTWNSAKNHGETIRRYVRRPIEPALERAPSMAPLFCSGACGAPWIPTCLQLSAFQCIWKNRNANHTVDLLREGSFAHAAVEMAFALKSLDRTVN